MADITISDHALVRYLERGMGLDLRPAKNAILNVVKRDPQAASIKSDGLTFILSQGASGTVVRTVLRGNASNKEAS